MAKSREEVAAVVRKTILDILPNVDDASLAKAKSLRDLGANSLDRVEIASLAMEDLRLAFPMSELSNVTTIDELIDALHSRATK